MMAPSVESDEVLMSRVARGQPEPLGILLRRYGGPLLTLIQRMLGDRHRSEELFQEVSLAVWIKRHNYIFPRPFRPWLFGIALNKCRQEFRAARPRTVSFTEHVHLGTAPLPASPDAAAISVETAAIVQTAVMRLPEQQRLVVVLRIWNGLSYTEISDLMERSESTVRSEMFHGLASLRKYLEPRLR
jgi:RNA polymerase sigma-70 factor (ECF subfamily)